MTDPKNPPVIADRWGDQPVAGDDPLAGLVHLSNLLGREPRLVQPGGGNTSIKVTQTGAGGAPIDALLVKGSGTDLRTIGREGFTRLSLSRLAALRHAQDMSDAEMMRFMAGCMLAEGPAPSVETPLHSLLPHRVIAHTHDVATMSLTNVSDATAERSIEVRASSSTTPPRRRRSDCGRSGAHSTIRARGSPRDPRSSACSAVPDSLASRNAGSPPSRTRHRDASRSWR